MTRKFIVRIYSDVELELDDQVIDVVDDEWRSGLYPLYTPEDIAEHIAYNVVVYKRQLSHLDGWADQPDTNVEFVEPDWFMDATEIKERK
jgi:hypothetical protein